MYADEQQFVYKRCVRVPMRAYIEYTISILNICVCIMLYLGDYSLPFPPRVESVI